MQSISHQVPPIIVTVSQFVKNKSIKLNAAFSRKMGYQVDGKFYTSEQLEDIYPTANVKIVAKIHDNRSTKQSGNGKIK